MSNVDQMPAEQALWAYSSMLYDSKQERELLKRELNIVIQQYGEMTAERNYWKRQTELLREIFIGGTDAEK